MLHFNKIIIIATSTFSLVANAQLEVKNAALNCSTKPTNFNQLTLASGWTNANGGNVDVFDKSSTANLVGIPENFMGKQEATDNYFGLLVALQPDNGAISSAIDEALGGKNDQKKSDLTLFSEYAQSELSEELVADVKYKFTYRISLADKSSRAISGFGAYFSNKQLNEKSSGLLKVEPSFVTKEVIKDKENWTEITGEFTAKGGEKYVIIGVFKEGYSIEKTIDKKQLDNKRAYYYLASGMDIRLAKPDKDKDGIADDEDACPDLFGKKTAKGCPDKDGDGIMDSKDACPEIAGLTQFDGCVDTDGDEIADNLDRCPTIKGVTSNKGCPEVKIDDKTKEIFKQALTGIQFETGKSTIKQTSNAILNGIVKALNDNPKWDLEIQVHSDNVGKADVNKTLSQKRAEAVKKYFVSKGIADSRLTPIGFGQDKPIADNKTPAGKAKNRRVAFEVSMLP